MYGSGRRVYILKHVFSKECVSRLIILLFNVLTIVQ